MISIYLIQIMSVLFFIFALRMRIWKTSLNTFIVFTVIFFISMSHEIEFLRAFWINYHLTVIATMMFVLMARVVYQSVRDISRAHRAKKLGKDCNMCPFQKDCERCLGK